MRNIAFIVGSLRKGAYTRLLSQAVVELAPPSFQLSEISIGELPFYNQDLDTATPPAQWVSFRNQVRSSDAMLFITPEYNRGMPVMPSPEICLPGAAALFDGGGKLVDEETRTRLRSMLADFDTWIGRFK
jgi:NAD(P)H-dependent FMN reductase